MLQLLELLAKLPAIFSIVHQIVLVVETVFPKASGAVKLDAAVTTAQAALPDVITAANSPGVAALVNLVVGLLNRPGGTFANARETGVGNSPGTVGG